MYKRVFGLALVLIMTLSISVAVSPRGASGISGEGTYLDTTSIQSAIDLIPKSSLGENEQAGIIYMREEEKLARDVYEASYEAHQLLIFQNIASAEQTHMDAMKLLVDRYELEDPVLDESGNFSDGDLQVLYDNLSLRSLQSLEEALLVGVLIEETDIADLQAHINETDNEDVVLVYDNLMKGSKNHLRSYVKVLERYGFSVTPQVLSQEQFDEILNSSIEKGLYISP